MKIYTIYDPFSGGHHSEYIYFVVKFWIDNKIENGLDVVTTQANIDQHPYLQKLYENPIQKILFYVVPELRKKSLIARSFEQSKFLSKYVFNRKPSHVLCMAFDWLQVPLIFGLKFSYNIKISGIYFRPTWHYSKWNKMSLKDHIRAIRQYLILSLAIRNRHIDSLLCLDPYAAESLIEKHIRCKVFKLPDPVERTGNVEKFNLRELYLIPEDRIIFLHMGYLDDRKGILNVLDAINLLESETQKRVAIVIAGKVDPKIDEIYKDKINNLPNDVIFVSINYFIPYDKFQLYIDQSDIILLAYKNHVGSSGLLLRAALSGKKVLSQDYGLMGHWTRQYCLGETVNALSHVKIAEAIKKMVVNTEYSGYNNSFISEHTVKAFQEIITQTLTDC